MDRNLSLLALSLPGIVGGDVTSVQQDQAQMKSTLKTTEAEASTIHELTAPGKTMIKEYVSPEGKVFTITWSGPFIPNMQQLLGTYFDRFAQAAKAQRESHLGHWPVGIQQPDSFSKTAAHARVCWQGLPSCHGAGGRRRRRITIRRRVCAASWSNFGRDPRISRRCGSSGTPVGVVTSITITPSSASLDAGQSVNITASVPTTPAAKVSVGLDGRGDVE